MTEHRTTYASPPGYAAPPPAAGLGAEAAPGERERARRRREPVIELVAGLAEDVSLLVRQEAELVRAELAEKLDQARSGVKALSAGAMLAYAGVILLLISLALGIDVWIDEPWLSMLIVGASVTLVGAILLARGRHDLRADALTPRRSADSLHQDADLFREQTRRP